MLSNTEKEEIIETNYQQIYRFFAASLEDQSEADDLTQEVFAFLIEKQDELTNDNIRSWLYSVAKFKLFKEKRRLNNNLRTVYMGDMHNEPADPISEDFIIESESENWSDDKIDEIRKSILSKLTDEELDIFIRVYVQHSKYSEISKVIGISESTISTRVCRIKKKILKTIDLILTVAIILIIKIRY